MSEKKLGVLGGMGPMATSVFFERVIKNTQATCDQEHIEMVILNHTSLPDRTTCIQTGQYEKFLNEVEKSLKTFELLKISHIAIPCNTSHYFFDKLQAMTDIPIIHMVDQTAATLADQVSAHSRIGVLGTDGTIKSDVYKNSIENRQMVYVAPDGLTQKRVMDAIYSIKASEVKQMDEVEEIIDYMVHTMACSKVILACTELSLLTLPDRLKPFCIDAMDVLVKESIRLADKDCLDTLLPEAITSVS